MQETRFKTWLNDERGMSVETIRSRISNCKRVERFEGNLDEHWDADRLDDLIDRLTYSKKDEQDGRRPKHKVPIDGDNYKGTATFRQAVSLYREFRSSDDRTAGSPGPPAKRRPGEQQTPKQCAWHAYAAAAITGLISTHGKVSIDEVPGMCDLASSIADEMIKREAEREPEVE